MSIEHFIEQLIFLIRYDVRNRLEDKSQFGLKPNLSHRMSSEERAFQEQLDMERYLALEWDEIRVEEQEGGLYLEFVLSRFIVDFVL